LPKGKRGRSRPELKVRKAGKNSAKERGKKRKNPLEEGTYFHHLEKKTSSWKVIEVEGFRRGEKQKKENTDAGEQSIKNTVKQEQD